MYQFPPTLLNDFITLVSLAMSAAVSAQETQDTRDLVITGVTLVDGTGSEPRENVTIVIRGSKVAEITTAVPDHLPAGAIVVDLQGKVVVPGLIDAHTHLATSPSREGYRDRVETQLRNLLGRGITDVRDMSGDGRVLAYLARQTRLGELAGPDIYFSSLLAGPNFFNDPRVLRASRGVEPGFAAWAHQVTTTTDLNALMHEVKGIGATGVKVYAGISVALLEQIVTAAHENDLMVWAHWVVQPRETRAADVVRAGVDVVSHSFMPLLDTTPDERATSAQALEAVGGGTLFDEMRRKGTILDATLIAATRLPARPGWVEPATFAVDVVRAAREAGVSIATGSDHPGDGTLPGIHLEYRLLASEAGFTPLEVIEAATRVSASAIGIADVRGTIAVGKDATMLILEPGVIESVDALATPLFVIKRGVIYSGANLRNLGTPVETLESIP